jgi:hypothetical protein
MILNHKTAIELLVENIDSAEFNRYTLMNLHSALAENLLPNPADEGRIRQHAVDISKSIYRPLSTAQQIEEVLDEVLSKANQIHDPFEQSFFMMVHLPYLQPFADINKRTSRLAANLPCFVATSARSPSSMYQNRPTAAPPSVCTKWPASNCYATCTCGLMNVQPKNILPSSGISPNLTHFA